MTQEDKELLLKDLCARLPYGVKVNEDIQGDTTLLGLTKERALTDCEVEGYCNDFPIELVKPYLFPLSSMTEEQYEELWKELDKDRRETLDRINAGQKCANPYTNVSDWYNKNHFDYRGLIPKGIAIDATGLNVY